MNDLDIMVSVCITAYNHEKYITKCVESILEQKTNFKFEIVLGEDDSKDATRDICIALSEKYPDVIRLFLRREEDKIWMNGRKLGRFNFIENFRASRGKYIALLDGDDYWTDSNKLQKQVDFLESNKKYTASSHWVDVVYEDSDKMDQSKFRFKGDITIDNIIKQRWITIQTGSVVFRRDFVNEHFLNTIRNYKGGAGDSILFSYLASKGPIHSMQEVMSVYRKHDGGSTRLSEKKFSNKEERKFRIRSFKGLILLLNEIDNLTSGEKRAMINKYRTGLRFDILMAKLGLKRGNIFSRGFKKIMKI